eukprot:3980291-Prorocentrum_lima.AAC.1
MKKFLESNADAQVYVTNSGVVLSASPIPPQFLVCATVNKSATDWVEAYHKSWQDALLIPNQESSIVFRTKAD